MSAEFQHIPVLLNECLEGLNIKESGIYLDGTVGGAGHSSEIAKRLNGGKLLCLDQDPDALAAATERLAPYPCAEVIQGNFRNASSLIAGKYGDGLDGALLDLGVSSHQLDDAERGFSYHEEGALDMRMSQSGLSAADIVNEWDWRELARIIRDYGEEQYAGSIAKKIEAARQQSPITTTSQLSEIVSSAVPAAVRRAKHPAKKTFMALRIAVNDEFDVLREGLDDIFNLLKPGGRFCVISFHSLEDRIVKQYFNSLFVSCTCPPDYPVCVCGGKAKAKAITKKPIIAGDDELSDNRRSRSAKLRIIEKL